VLKQQFVNSAILVGERPIALFKLANFVPQGSGSPTVRQWLGNFWFANLVPHIDEAFATNAIC
jgi:hypothetical protein